MFLKNVSIAALILASATANVSFAQGSSEAEVLPAVGLAEVELDANDLIAEAEMDHFVEVLESMPEELQALPMHHADVLNYLNENLPGSGGFMYRGSWLSWGCTGALAAVAVGTGFPAAKIITTMKAARKIAGSWKGVALMVKTHRWGAMGAEAVKILGALTGIDNIIKKCT